MPVASEYTPVQTACNGSLVAFAFDFPIFDTSDLKVYLKTVATGVKALLVETTNYTVSATNNDYTNGGTVTTVSTYSNAYEIIIERDIPYTQPTDLEQAGRIPSDTLDDTHDRALMQIQQVNNKVQRALVMPVSDDSDLDMELPNEIDRASQFLGFDADGEPIAAQTITGGTAATAYMQTLLDDADAATAKVTLEVMDAVPATRYFAPSMTGYAGASITPTGTKITFGADGTAYLPINLPHGAIVTNLYSNAELSDGNVQAALSRSDKTSQSGTEMAKNTHSSTGALNDSTITNATIDNNTYNYYVEGIRISHSSTAYLRGVVITYTVVNPLP